ncbi:MAG TPA: hypothetical protein VMS77_03810 [Conexivisphaerales archaeon]|nr:hypothetical protein [Conexivisphaerales archaeon]
MSVGFLADRSRRTALVSLFAVIIFISKSVFPPPSDDAFVFFQTMLLILSAFLMGPPGATYTSTLSGVLKALVTGSFAPLTVALAVLYGLLIDGFVLLFRARPKGRDVSYARVVSAAAFSTSIEGTVGYVSSVMILQLPIPNDFVIDMSILAGGIISGLIGGWLAAFVWKRYLFPKPAEASVEPEKKAVPVAPGTP